MSVDRAAIMLRAWAIFRETYRYPSIPFASIGRKCFAWALREAWAEAKEAARRAAIPAETKAARAAALHRELELLPYAENYAFVTTRHAAITAELASLGS